MNGRDRVLLIQELKLKIPAKYFPMEVETIVQDTILDFEEQ